MAEQQLTFDLRHESPWLAREQLIKAAPELAKHLPPTTTPETKLEAWEGNLRGLARVPSKRNVRIERRVDDPSNLTVFLDA